MNIKSQNDTNDPVPYWRAAVAAIVAFYVLTREYGDPARQLTERETVTKP